ncbi:hypothetical protein, partial [Pseudomonas viridiflava]|uniref:hypothetical protein n=1 Tax=Pseudomonas viridiflava TaxID=33069 RepID=UPI001F120594
MTLSFTRDESDPATPNTVKVVNELRSGEPVGLRNIHKVRVYGAKKNNRYIVAAEFYQNGMIGLLNHRN